MEFVKKILILVVVVLFIYILMRLLKKRAEIKIEGLQNPTVSSSASVAGIPAEYKSSQLGKFYVKSSIDSAYNGSTVSVDMVNYILSRGYRFIDFEVYLEIPTDAPSKASPTAVVGYSQYGNYPRLSSNNIKLNDVITAIMHGAFTTTSPNPTDPLFLQIRPMYQIPTKNDENTSAKQGNNTQLNTQIETVLAQLKHPSNLLAGSIKSTTRLSDIMGKIVVIMDTSTTYGKKSNHLLSMISIDPHSKQMNTIHTGIVTAQPIQTTDKKKTVSNKTITAALPYDNNGVLLTDNPNPNTVLVQFAPNFSPVMAWYNTDLLATYENIFASHGNSAFVELSIAKSNATRSLTLNNGVVGP